MTHVDIDDFECPKCKKITMADLDMKTSKYTCIKCGKSFGGLKEDWQVKEECDNTMFGRCFLMADTGDIIGTGIALGFGLITLNAISQFDNNMQEQEMKRRREMQKRKQQEQNDEENYYLSSLF